MTRTTRLAMVAAAALLLAGCVPSGPPTLEQINAEFAQTIEPNWQTEVPGIFGEPVVRDGIVAVYAKDDEVGLRLKVFSTETGELLWDAVASPGGAWGAPLFEETDSVSRSYPVPAITPLVASRGSGEDEQLVIVFFERAIEDSIVPDDLLRVADARTGDLLEVTIPGYDEYEDYLDSVRIRDDGEIAANVYSPGRPCGDGPTFCFEEPEEGEIVLDLGTLEVSLKDRLLPENPDLLLSREWGADYLRISDEDVSIARFTDGEVLWERPADDIFEDDRSSPPALTDFIAAGDVVVVQGYQSIMTTPELGNQLDLDYTTSRTAVALDPDTGETRWLLKGVDSLCYAVMRYPRDGDVLPMCRVTDGFFSYSYDNDEMIDEEPVVASIVGVDVTDGSIVWEAEHLGEQSISHVSRMADASFASRGDFASVPRGDDEAGLLDLRDGTWIESPENSTFVCQAERPGVKLEFEGSIFVGGRNPIALEYPAGWQFFPCDADAEPAAWSKGAVRVAGIPAGAGTVILPTEDGLVSFTLK